MEILVNRFKSNEFSTLGQMYLDGDFKCYTVEDAYHPTKIWGRTRIPAGEYTVHLRKPPEAPSKFDPRYSAKFGIDFYHGMLELEGVPNYSGVMIHIGNSAKDTEGCILVGMGANQNPDADGSFQVTHSEEAFREIYPIIRKALEGGEKVTINIQDNDSPIQ